MPTKRSHESMKTPAKPLSDIQSPVGQMLESVSNPDTQPPAERTPEPNIEQAPELNEVRQTLGNNSVTANNLHSEANSPSETDPSPEANSDINTNQPPETDSRSEADQAPPMPEKHPHTRRPLGKFWENILTRKQTDQILTSIDKLPKNTTPIVIDRHKFGKVRNAKDIYNDDNYVNKRNKRFEEQDQKKLNNANKGFRNKEKPSKRAERIVGEWATNRNLFEFDIDKPSMVVYNAVPDESDDIRNRFDGVYSFVSTEADTSSTEPRTVDPCVIMGVDATVNSDPATLMDKLTRAYNDETAKHVQSVFGQGYLKYYISPDGKPAASPILIPRYILAIANNDVDKIENYGKMKRIRGMDGYEGMNPSEYQDFTQFKILAELYEENRLYLEMLPDESGFNVGQAERDFERMNCIFSGAIRECLEYIIKDNEYKLLFNKHTVEREQARISGLKTNKNEKPTQADKEYAKLLFLQAVCNVREYQAEIAMLEQRAAEGDEKETKRLKYRKAAGAVELRNTFGEERLEEAKQTASNNTEEESGLTGVWLEAYEIVLKRLLIRTQADKGNKYEVSEPFNELIKIVRNMRKEASKENGSLDKFKKSFSRNRSLYLDSNSDTYQIMATSEDYQRFHYNFTT